MSGCLSVKLITPQNDFDFGFSLFHILINIWFGYIKFLFSYNSVKT